MRGRACVKMSNCIRTQGGQLWLLGGETMCEREPRMSLSRRPKTVLPALFAGCLGWFVIIVTLLN